MSFFSKLNFLLIHAQKRGRGATLYYKENTHVYSLITNFHSLIRYQLPSFMYAIIPVHVWLDSPTIFMIQYS